MEKNKLYPIYGIIHTPFWQTQKFYIALGFLFLIFFIVIVYYIYKRYFKVKKVTIYQEIFSEIEELKGLLKKGILSKTFYFRLTWLIKRYLHVHYGYDVYGKTDSELVIFLKKTNLKQSLFEKLELILTGNEVVKFANEFAIKERMESDLQRSIEFINASRD